MTYLNDSDDAKAVRTALEFMTGCRGHGDAIMDQIQSVCPGESEIMLRKTVQSGLFALLLSKQVQAEPRGEWLLLKAMAN